MKPGGAAAVVGGGAAAAMCLAAASMCLAAVASMWLAAAAQTRMAMAHRIPTICAGMTATRGIQASVVVIDQTLTPIVTA